MKTNPIKPSLGSKFNFRSSRFDVLWAVLLLASSATLGVAAQTLLYRNDFSDPSKPLIAGGFATFYLTNQQIVLTCTNASATDTNNLSATSGGVEPPPTLFPNRVLPDQQTLELRLDLIAASQDDAFADLHWGNNTKGYLLVKDQNEIGLLKAWDNWTKGAVFFWTNTVVKNENVTLVLSLTHLGSNLKINARVLDKDNAGAVLFEHTVIDTPQADPVLPDRAVKGIRSELDPVAVPWALQSFSYPVIGVIWINPQSGPTSLAKVIYDNLEVWQYESPPPANLKLQPVPHHLRSVTVAPNGTVALSLDGSVSGLFNLSGTISNQFRQMFDIYVVEASSNLKDWTPLARLLRTNSNPNPLVFQDTHAVGLSHRFYRTVTNHLLTAFPKPSGPYAVGTVDRVMIDPARTNLYRYSPPTNAFMVTFWYPADPPAAGLLPARMWDPRFAADTSFYSQYMEWAADTSAYGTNVIADLRDALVFPNLVGHRFGGVALASGADKFPVILFSTHSSGSRKRASHIAEELASHGYIVVAMDHIDCWGTEFPDGRYLAGTRNGSESTPSRLMDMRFLLDELAVLNSADALFARRLDLNRIGAAGTCVGGMMAEICRSDSRVKCAAISDAYTGAVNRAGLQKPLLVAAGQYGLFYSDGQWLFSKATNNATWLQIRGGNHGTATDGGWTFEILSGCGPARALDACLVWFFDTYLKGEAPPFPTNPEIYNVQRK